MEIVSQQKDEGNPNLWHFKIAGVATGGEIRLADLSRETPSPANWLAANQAEAQVAIDAGVVNEEYNERGDFSGLESDISNQLSWISTTLPDIDTGLAGVDGATLVQLRGIVKGLLQNQRRILLIVRGVLKAFRYVIRRLR